MKAKTGSLTTIEELASSKFIRVSLKLNFIFEKNYTALVEKDVAPFSILLWLWVNHTHAYTHV